MNFQAIIYMKLPNSCEKILLAHSYAIVYICNSQVLTKNMCSWHYNYNIIPIDNYMTISKVLICQHKSLVDSINKNMTICQYPFKLVIQSSIILVIF